MASTATFGVPLAMKGGALPGSPGGHQGSDEPTVVVDGLPGFLPLRDGDFINFQVLGLICRYPL